MIGFLLMIIGLVLSFSILLRYIGVVTELLALMLVEIDKKRNRKIREKRGKDG